MTRRALMRVTAIFAVLALVVVVACGKKKPVPPPVLPVPVVAAAVAPPPVDAGLPEQPVSTQPPLPKARLELLLRSTPAGAAASVDGRVVGTTPVRVEVADDGRAHDFAFALPGYRPWKLHFVPVRDGAIHATLEEMPLGPDAG